MWYNFNRYNVYKLSWNVYLFNFLRLVILKVVSEISKQSKDKEYQKGKNKEPSLELKKQHHKQNFLKKKIQQA